MPAEALALPAFLIVLVVVIFAVALVAGIAVLAWVLSRGRPDPALAARVAELEDTVRRMQARLDGMERRHVKPIDPDETHVEPAP